MTTIQEEDDEFRDTTVNKLLGGRATFSPESVFPPGTVSVPQHVSPPKPASPPKPVYQPASDVRPVLTGNAASIVSSPTPPQLTWGEIMDALDAELEEAEKHKEQKVSKEKESRKLVQEKWEKVRKIKKKDKVKKVIEKKEKVEDFDKKKKIEQKEKDSLELVQEKREKVIKKKDKVDEVIEKKEKVEDFDKKKKIKQKEKSVDVREQNTAYSTPNTKGVELFIRGLDSAIDEQHLYRKFFQFGNITSAQFMMSKGYGFVSYSSEAEANTAIREMNGKIVGRNLLSVNLSKKEVAKQKKWLEKK